ncbi:MAG: ATP-binding cassette domain-containing protein, partial [Anaerovoracaceae bacterium]|nr:ATP-binding cassette domain-containing protein [Anaerovoracaceae bacterium]
MRPFYNREEKALALKNMRRMGIDGIARKSYRKLSGGQQQRVLLARALCAARKLLFLDEPVSGLDPGATAEMYSLIKDLNKKDGLGIIMISHDISHVISCADHILHIGNELFFGTTEEYMERRELHGKYDR